MNGECKFLCEVDCVEDLKDGKHRLHINVLEPMKATMIFDYLGKGDRNFKPGFIFYLDFEFPENSLEDSKVMFRPLNEGESNNDPIINWWKDVDKS